MKLSWKALFGVIFVILGVVLYNVSQLLATFAITIPPACRPNSTPALLQLPFETVETISRDGMHLKGWWVPAANGVPTEAPVMVIHGLGAGKEFMLSYIALAHAEGHPVLAIDLRGHGESEACFTTLGDREPLDGEAWIHWLAEHGQGHPILWGTSLGAVTALRTAAANPEVAGVIADAPFDTLRHTLAVHARLFFGLPEYPWVPLAAWQVERRLHFKVSEVDSYAAVRRIHVPLLLIAAAEDRRMSVASIRALYAAANEPKEYYLIPGADHETRRFEPEFRARIAAFLKRCDTQKVQPVPVANGG